METSEATEVGIVIERRALNSAWADHDWRPVAVLPGLPELPAGQVIAEETGRTRYFAGMLELRLHRKDTESYRYNLQTGSPRLYVALRSGEGPGDLPMRAFQVTAAPDEAQSWAEVGTDIVDGVPMPESIAVWVHEFVERFHVDAPHHKRQRASY